LASNRYSFWGVDVGGTSAKIGCISSEHFEMVNSIPTGENCEPGNLLEQTAHFILAKDPEPAAIGIGTAGLIDREHGIIRFSPNLPLWNGINPGTILRKYLNAPIILDNDCNAFAIGAINSGQIPLDGLWIFITLGTGIGGSIVNQGQILYGTGTSGEFGHTAVKEGGIPCPCGSEGCWERYAGKKALEWYYFRLSGRCLSPVAIAALASSGDHTAVEAFKEYGRWIGIGLASLANCFSPMGFFIAGGLSSSLCHFGIPARQEYKRRCKQPWSVSLLENSPSAGAFGAASMAKAQC
jgi:glucokinase